VTIGNQTYIEEFLVVDQLSIDVILGDPWLRHAHVTLDYGLRCAHHGTTQRSTTYWTGRRLPPTGVIPSPQVQHGFPADLHILENIMLPSVNAVFAQNHFIYQPTIVLFI
jgi:hypothetical protein